MPRASRREKGAFKTTLAGALKNVQDSLRLFGRDSGKPVSGVVLSSNVTLGADRPADPGVAVWFTWEGAQYCIPVDRYETPAANLQAIHHVLEARRVELRHGTLALVRATFAGFRSLPAPAAARNWREVIGVGPEVRDMPAVRIAFKKAASKAHPDKGGSDAAMSELNAALAAAEKELNR
ncbi:MAG: hypothetical protein RXR52_35365 [Paraburkholderia sp.]|uniref:hypothetical protein n=1 Tax=Burkholderiaceae TaxID=119060 RepID=UPI001BB0E98E|nr:hypothetical protein [Burkholderia sp. 4M9327F10]